MLESSTIHAKASNELMTEVVKTKKKNKKKKTTVK